MQRILFTNNISEAVSEVLASLDFNRSFVLTDVNTRRSVLPRVPSLAALPCIEIGAGDVNKNLDSLAEVWRQLDALGATRRSVLINLGGGVVTDLGGFAAASFKRGIRFINVPTTLLSAVDAAVGGKTGINFGGLKNEIGVFQEAEAVIISTLLFSTLPIEEVKSGFAEMLKHGLLSSSEAYSRLLQYDFSIGDGEHLLSLLKESVEVKRHIVEQDPHEQGLRRALNLGHTFGHAFESFALGRHKPIPHGYAVAWGLVAESVLSHLRLGLDSSVLHSLSDFVYENYGAFGFTCDDYDALISLMRHDKKSENGEINLTLLRSPGDVVINQIASADEAKSALDIFRDLMHE